MPGSKPAEQTLDLLSKRRPNVIWVFGDQHRAHAVGYRGNPDVRTPNIDNLARSGVRFDSAVAGAPWCSPFRAALLTGQYPHQCGVPRTPSPLDPSIPTIAAPFKEAGYHTAWVGKWHVDGSNHYTHYVPPGRRGGFDYWMGYENNNKQNECFVYGSETESPVRLPGYETDSLTDIFLDHIEGHVAAAGDGDYQPFFAALSVQPPHDPYVTPTNPGQYGYPHTLASVTLRENVPRVQRIREQAALDLAGYYGMVENLDYNLGRIRDALKRLDADRETYIFFFSDHGDMLGSHGQRGKSSPWEESIRIPFLIGRIGGAWHMNAGISNAVINHVDIPVTTLGLCGIDAPKTMTGYDYSRHCHREGQPGHRGPADPSGEPDSAYLQQIPRKLHRHSVNKAWRGVVMRDGWKYVCMPGVDWLLHDTVSDPFEQANLAHDIVFQEQKERCHQRLARWIHETGDVFELPVIGLD